MKNTTKTTMKTRLVNALLTIASILVLLTLMFSFNVSASYYNGFPLEYNSKAYGISVLGKYGGGTKHSSYINDYVLKKSYTYCDFVMDIMAPQGTKVYAVEQGKVYQNYYTSNGGWIIVLRHNDGNYSYYGHLRERALIPVGKTVSAGTLLGYVGMTGSATGYHLHFEWSGHDPYCTYSAKGICYIASNSGASKYPHLHSGATTVNGTSNVIKWNQISVKNVTTQTAYVRCDITTNVRQLRQIGLQWGTTTALNNTPVSWNTAGLSKLTFCSVQFGEEAPRLQPNTKYYFRFYVTTTSGTKCYSNTYSFATKSATCSHIYNSGKYTKYATCTTPGSKICTCSKCGATKTVAIAAYGHNYQNGMCTRCGTKIATVIAWNQIYASNITRNHAYVRCDITTDVKQIREIGLQWGTTTSLNNTPISWSTVGLSKLTFCSVQFGTEAPSLQPNTTYYYRFYVTTSSGERLYSGMHSFRTAK